VPPSAGRLSTVRGNTGRPDKRELYHQTYNYLLEASSFLLIVPLLVLLWYIREKQNDLADVSEIKSSKDASLSLYL